MKRYVPYLLIIVLPFLISGTNNHKTSLRCDEGNSISNSYESSIGDKIGVVIDTTAYFTVSPKVLSKAIQYDSISFLGYARPENITIDKINFLTYNHTDYYLFAKGNFYSPTGSEKINFIIAYELIYKSDALFNVNKSVNMCRGVGCSACEYDTNASGSIIGCKCQSGGGSGTCDHSIIALDAIGSGFTLLDISEAYNLLASE